MLNKELELVKSLTTTLASFKEDPSLAARHKGRVEESPNPGYDPGVWAPPIPQEPRYQDKQFICGREGVQDTSERVSSPPKES